MALHITNPETERNVRRLAYLTGEPISEAVNKAALERLEAIVPREEREKLMADIHEILREVDALPRLDDRAADEILGYDENGLPT
jgi:antitoxin VapB